MPRPRRLTARAPRALALLTCVVLAVTCSGDDRSYEETEASAGYAGADADIAVAEEGLAVTGARGFAQAPMAPSEAPATARQRMLVRTGSATVEVGELDPAVQAVRGIAERAGGFLGGVAIMGGRDQTRMATLTLRIPATRFDETIVALDSLGEVESVHLTSEDVGEQYADLEVRIANARRLETRLLELLATRTGSLEDVLAVERELARIREEIERMDAQMRSIRDRVDLSTLSVTLHEPEPLFSSGGDHMLVRAVRQAGRNFVGLVAAAIASLGVVLPLAVLLAVLWRVWRWRQRRRSRAAS